MSDGKANAGNAIGITFGRWLKQTRQQRGIGSTQFAELIGCSTITLLKIEAGERRPSRQIAALIAEQLHTPADEMEAFVAFARRSPTLATRASEIAAHAPWRAAHSGLANLPTTLTSLVGRETDTHRARSLILQTKVRLLTLTGAPGIGKTRLALQVASDLVGNFDDGVFLVEFAPVSDPDLLWDTIAHALELSPESTQSIEDALFEHLSERRLLLVLDNFEHLLDAAPRVVRLLEACPWLKVLTTSREALHVRGERRYVVPPLGTPGKAQAQLPDPEALAGYASVELFVERAQAVDPDFTLTEENAGEIAAICAGLEGLPLAIELAAGNAKYLSLREMRAALEKPLKLLAGGSRDLPHRQRTLRSAIEWSYGLLNSDEQRLFRILGVFVGGFTLDAAEAIWDERDPGSKYNSASALELLRSLEEKNLVRRESGGEDMESRFGMLEAIHEYAREKLQEDGPLGQTGSQAQVVEHKHALLFVRLAEEAEPLLSGEEQSQWLSKLEREHGNIRAALAWSLSPGGNVEIALRLGAALWRFWWVRGYAGEGREWLARALAQGHSAPTTMRARALYASGNLAWQQGDHIAARPLLEESLALNRQLGDKRAIARSLTYLGLVMRALGDYAGARTVLEESLALGRELGDTAAIASTLNVLGILARSFEDQTAARALFEESLALLRLLGNNTGIAIVLNNLGLVTRDQGDSLAARSLFEEAIALHRSLGNQAGMASALNFLGLVAQDGGNYAEARALFEESLALHRSLGDRAGVADSLGYLGSVARKEGDTEGARKLLEESVAIFRELGQKGSVGEVLRELGDLLQDRGDLSARGVLEESLAIQQELGDMKGAGSTLIILGSAAYREGEYEEAHSLYRRGLQIKVDVDDKAGVALSLARIGGMATRMSANTVETLRGAKLLGAADALMEELHMEWPHEDHIAHLAALEAAREQLAEEAFREAFAQGRAMSMEGAVEIA